LRGGMVDALDLKSNVFDVWVQVPSQATLVMER